MLSETEQRRLTEIERELRSADPQFAARFGHATIEPVARRWRGMTARGWLITAALIMGFAVLTSSPGMALIGLSVAGVSAGWWLTGYRRSGEDDLPPQR